VGLASAGGLWLLRRLESMAQLEQWQREMVGSWSAGEAVAVALLSGVAEEALIRAFLQPLIGLWLAAAVFAVLHLAPDRRLWMWPFVALTIGLVLGVLYELSGYPGCAAAHVTINLVALLRLRSKTPPEDRDGSADSP
jgi:membrane protease YdiL (CAAX protease family)